MPGAIPRLSNIKPFNPWARQFRIDPTSHKVRAAQYNVSKDTAELAGKIEFA
jgi:hypothetical protein